MQKVQTDVKKLEPDFLVVVVPRNTDEPYKSVKQFLGREAGIPSQFVTMQNIQKDVMTKATKVVKLSCVCVHVRVRVRVCVCACVFLSLCVSLCVRV